MRVSKPQASVSRLPVVSPAREKAKSLAALSLPKETSKPLTDLAGATILIFGERKIGKTSFCARFKKPLFLMFEPGGKGLAIYQRPVTSWDAFGKYIDLVLDSDFQNVIIDTADRAYDLCLEHMCERNGVEWPTDNAQHGALWKKIKKEFDRQILRIIHGGKGVVFVSHAQIKEIQDRNGLKTDKLVPAMSNQCRDVVCTHSDIMGYYGYYGYQRQMTIRGSDMLEGGTRLEKNFLTPSGQQIHTIPMGNSADEAFANFVKAFSNKQTKIGKPEEKARLSETTIKRQTTNRR